ncbi:hypothetical protein BANT918_01626 [Brevibacterium antiquum CNRZ 918]|uniref:Uncharacterized protein n=1 Tax=Brevibacterium antiquum CNRZ 918 TaxID=1255637 RepID=A0A2H1JGF4_9MICO|nr:hypothetical protein BANT918_01626 [Brevibacterium antiquum CNRZ 918]
MEVRDPIWVSSHQLACRQSSGSFKSSGARLSRIGRILDPANDRYRSSSRVALSWVCSTHQMCDSSVADHVTYKSRQQCCRNPDGLYSTTTSSATRHIWASSGRDGEQPEEFPIHATDTVKVLIGSNNNSGNTSCPDETSVWVEYLRGLKRQPSTQLDAAAHLQFYGPRQRTPTHIAHRRCRCTGSGSPAISWLVKVA